MTIGQYRAHARRMEEHRADFMEYWQNELLPKLKSESADEHEIMRVMRACWINWIPGPQEWFDINGQPQPGHPDYWKGN